MTIDTTKGLINQFGSISATARPAVCDKHLFLHFYNSLKFHSKKARNVFLTYFFTHVQNMKLVEAILSEKIEVTERWGVSDVWLRDSSSQPVLTEPSESESVRLVRTGWYEPR